jgi:hypothetical protein
VYTRNLSLELFLYKANTLELGEKQLPKSKKESYIDVLTEVYKSQSLL